MFKKLIIFMVVVLVGGLLIGVLNIAFFNSGAERAIAPTEGIDGNDNPRAGLEVPVPGSDPLQRVEDEASVPETVVVPSEAVVIYSNSGFSPGILAIKAGDTAIFRNQGQRDFWPASALHPTHAVYDGTTLNEHCGDGGSSFDSCRGIPPGGEWEFVFNKVGTWRYHDHLNASRTGTIVVE